MLSCHLTLFRWDCYLLQVWSTYCNIIQQPLHAFVQRVRDILQLKNMLPSVPFHCCMFVYTLLLAASIHRQWPRVGQKLFDPSDHIHDLWVLAHVDVRRVSVISIGHTKYGSTDDLLRQIMSVEPYIPINIEKRKDSLSLTWTGKVRSIHIHKCIGFKKIVNTLRVLFHYCKGHKDTISILTAHIYITSLFAVPSETTALAL